jgi:hypothetical protein
MDPKKRELKGSPSRDRFKQWHKTLDGSLYASDFDLVLVEKFHKDAADGFIVANLEYKEKRDDITFAEAHAYNDCLRLGIPVYFVKSEKEDSEMGRFYISQYLGGNPKPRRPGVNLKFLAKTANSDEYQDWERKLRNLRLKEVLGRSLK